MKILSDPLQKAHSARLQDLGRPPRLRAAALTCAAALAVCACSQPSSDAVAQPSDAREAAVSAADAPPAVDEARAFIEQAEAELREHSEYHGRISWVQSNFITFDTNWLAARAAAAGTELAVRLANDTRRFDELDLPADIERKMNILRTGIRLPAPMRPGAAQELADIATWLETTYATGTYNYNGEALDLPALERIIDRSRDPDELAEIWAGWRTVSPPMAQRYARMVSIANEGARELGFSNLAEMWLSTYDMSPQAMEQEVERLWSQVEPLYEQLHCHVRARLNEHYGDSVQPIDAPIRADLLGNMWAQQWDNIYDLVAWEEDDPGIDLTRILRERDYTPVQMVETAEAFFTFFGFEPLPETFWERSLFAQPRDRNVGCHASAWSIDSQDDLRIKMCTEVNADDFQTIHHELGHNFYQRAYAHQDFLFQGGAHDGFHEAVGDFIALSVTPEYLREIDLIEQVPDAAADLGLLLEQALEKIAFLPFGMLMDQWRWRVLRGDVGPEDYNRAWWELRERYQGIRPPVERPADAFDPGAKYHIPANVPYLRYFLSFIMQFQFHEAACELAGWDGPLHRCSIYANEEVGRRFQAMLEMGRSRPWQDALEAFTGTRNMDASAIIDYFAPLMARLEEENAGRQCGW